MPTATSPALILCLLLVFPSISPASEFSLVVSGPTALQLSPGLIVEKSPGTKPGSKLKCERVEIHGLPRIKHLDKFANSVKVKVSRINPTGHLPKIEVCFHRNISIGVGMCAQDQWERLTKESWVKPMSPYDHKILDIRMGESHSERLEVSLDEEFFWYRILFLVSGIVLMILASWLSKSLIFYYSGAMAVGVFLVILMVLFQGMKILPTGRKSSLGIFLYSSFIGLGSFLLRYVPRLLRSLLTEIGLSEDMYNPLAIFLLVFLVITGAWLGFWVVRKLVLTEDGSIDIGVSHFVTWSIRIVASVLILQSSVDPLLAVEALVGGIVFSSVLRWLAHSKVVRRVYKKLCRAMWVNFSEPIDPYASPVIRVDTSNEGSSNESPTRLSESETFYSTYHHTPDRRKFTKEEWKSLSRETTRRQLKELVSSPDFNKWAVSHADEITLTQKKEIGGTSRWFCWF